MARPQFTQRRYEGRHLSRQKGQAVIEHIIIWPVLAFVVLSAIQLGFLYRDKATLNDAAFRAAREGSLNNAFLGPMRRTVVESLVPLYMAGEASPTAYAMANVRAFAENLVNPVNGNTLGQFAGVEVEIISPNRDIFGKLSRDMHALQDDCPSPTASSHGNDRSRCQEVRFRQIPNDNLNIRSDETQRVKVETKDVDMNVQDANLLKIRAHYCAELVVPLAARVGFSLAGFLFGETSWWDFYGKTDIKKHNHWASCRNRTLATRAANSAGVGVPAKYYIPISSTAIVRMQSPVRCEGSNNGNNCRNLK